MLPSDWIAHTRADGEVLGWMLPDGDGFVVFDRLGRALTGTAVDWLAGEELLERHGIGFLAEKWRMTDAAGHDRDVRIAEVTGDHIDVVTDDWGAAAAVGSELERIRLPFPAPAHLRRR